MIKSRMTSKGHSCSGMDDSSVSVSVEIVMLSWWMVDNNHIDYNQSRHQNGMIFKRDIGLLV